MVGAVRRTTIKVSGVMALSVQLTMTHNTTSPLTALPTEPSGCHTPILKRECVAVKVVSRKPSHMEPSCCHSATSDEGASGKTTLHQLDTRREASIRRSMWDNALTAKRDYLHSPTNLALPCYDYCLSVLWAISFSSATTWSNFSRNANCCFNSFSNSSSCAVFIRAYSVLLHASAFIVDSK